MENLFDRAKALNLDTWAEGKVILDTFASVNKLLNKATYSAADKTKILQGLDDLGVKKSDTGGKYVVLRQNRGKLLKRPAGKPVEVVANRRADWIGWVELKTERVSGVATQMTAQVVRDVNADVLATIEVDNRTALVRFNEQGLPLVGGAVYAHAMLIDGNDERGIDVGVLTRANYPVALMRSHVDDENGGARTFSRDCPEYQIDVPGGQSFLLMVNHLKSKGYGGAAASNAKRRAQADRVKAIYDQRRAEGVSRIAIVGDMNDTPDSQPLDPLLGTGSDLKDVSEHPNYQNDGRIGTYDTGAPSNKIDYILLSPALFQAVTAAGVERRGVWGGKNGTLWTHYPEMNSASDAASDHAAIWADLAI